MRITNDCVQQDTISVEVNGSCATITEIVNQTPQIDCDELMVCIGPHLVSLNDLIMDVYQYVQTAQANNVNYFIKLFNQYNMLLDYFMKCCNDLIGRLTRIEKRVNNLIVIRQIVIEKPQRLPVSSTPSRAPQQIVVPKPPVIITEERYVIDQFITSGYLDAYIRYDKFGNKLIDQYVMWLKTDDGFKRKLVPKEVPYQKGTPLANDWIEKIKAVYNENRVELNMADIKYKVLQVPFSFLIPKFSNRWVVEGTKVVDLNGNDLARFLPIIYNKQDGDFTLERVIKYRVDTKIKRVIGNEPVFMTYQVLNNRTKVRTIYEQGVNFWIKYS
jgi:hypothetical protein